MIEVPDPVPLDLPPGDVDGLEGVVEDVAGAAYWLTVLASGLTGPAAAAPGWLGQDAAAAAAQVSVVAGLARDCARAVGAAAHRLRQHHDLLVDVRRRISALREEQRDDFAGTWQRLSRLEDPQLAVMVGAAAWAGPVTELRAAEAARRRLHAALLEEVDTDAAATAGVLAESSAVVGGRGARGDGDRVLAHLAAELPGWGDRVLAARGRELAVELATLLSPEERDRLAGDALALAGSPAFAAAVLTGLGREGVAETLAALGDGVLGPQSSLARFVAVVFGAALPRADGDARLAGIVHARYVDAGDPGPGADLLTYGLAAVLVADGSLRSGGLRPATVVGWARQILAREAAFADVPPEFRVHPLTGDPLDPLAAVLDAVAGTGDPASAAAVLAEPAAWSLFVARPWADGGAALAEVAALATGDAGRDGATATRRGLEALGAGLGDDGDPADWRVDRGTAAAVAPALAAGVASHVPVVTAILGSGADGSLDGRASDLLRGLGYLTIDPGAAGTVGAALYAWVRAQPLPVELTCEPVPHAVVVVPSAFLAVREYGQRLDHALHGFEQQAAAERRQSTWDATFGLLVELPRGTAVGAGLGLVEGYAAMALGFDGRWDNGEDGGRHFDRDRAAGSVLGLAPADPAVRRGLAAQARAVFDATVAAMGSPEPPVSPELDVLAPVKDVAGDLTVDRILRDRAGATGLFGDGARRIPADR